MLAEINVKNNQEQKYLLFRQSTLNFEWRFI